MDTHPMPKMNLSQSVKQYLTEYIRSAHRKGLSKLPPENVVARNLGVSRVTLRRALDELERDGVVIRLQGRGTFINPEAVKIQANLVPGEEFRSLIQACGYTPSVELIRAQKRLPEEALARTLGLEPGQEIYTIEKLFCADGHPAVISVDHFAAELVGTLPDLQYVEEHSVFELLRERAGVVIERDKIAIESVSYRKACSCAESGVRLECDSVLLFDGINYDRANRPVLVDTELYDTSYIRFHLLRVKNVY